jgi:hypothetical protein
MIGIVDDNGKNEMIKNGSMCEFEIIGKNLDGTVHYAAFLKITDCDQV